MAGTNPNFDAAGFRAGIRLAMQMGAPVKESDRVTFVFKETKTYNVRTDPEGNPLDPFAQPVSTTVPRANTQVDCALEFSDATADELPVGNFRPTKVVVTVFDTDYEVVKDAKELLIGGDRYLIGYERPPLGLFEVGMHQIVAFAIDES